MAFSSLGDDIFQEEITQLEPMQGKSLTSFPPLSQDQISKVVWSVISSPHARGIVSVSSTNTKDEEPPVAPIVLPSEVPLAHSWKTQGKKSKKHHHKHNKNKLHKISQKKISELISNLVSFPGPFSSGISLNSEPEPIQNALPPLPLHSVSEEKTPVTWEERLTKLENTLAEHIRQCPG